MSEFDKAIEYVLDHEGGYSNHPADPGGATNFGITAKVAARYGISDVKHMTVDQAKHIYRQEYWHHGWIQDQRVATKVFDAGINIGVGRAFQLLQRACRDLGAMIKPDGIPGPQTREAVNSYSADDLLKAFAKRQQDYYELLAELRPASKVFLKGWTARAQQVPNANA